MILKITLSESNQAKKTSIVLFHLCDSRKCKLIYSGRRRFSSCLVSRNEEGTEGEITKGQEETLR